MFCITLESRGGGGGGGVRSAPECPRPEELRLSIILCFYLSH